MCESPSESQTWDQSDCNLGRLPKSVTRYRRRNSKKVLSLPFCRIRKLRNCERIRTLRNCSDPFCRIRSTRLHTRRTRQRKETTPEHFCRLSVRSQSVPHISRNRRDTNLPWVLVFSNSFSLYLYNHLHYFSEPTPSSKKRKLRSKKKSKNLTGGGIYRTLTI